MKKITAIIALVAILLTGCSSSSDDKVITVGATAVPHAEILEAARPQIEAAGYTLEIQVFDDYIMPNKALDNGDLDANYFQHASYLEEQINEFGYDFTAVANVHVEPIQIYSKKYQDISEIEEGATVYMSNSTSDQARILSVLADEGLITIKDGVDSKYITFDDIEENKLNLQFDYDYEASLLPQIYDNDEGDLVAINTNYALTYGVDSSEILMGEGEDSPYANVIAVRTEDVDSEKTQVLVDALTSEEVQTYITDTYDGAVIPATN